MPILAIAILHALLGLASAAEAGAAASTASNIDTALSLGPR